MLLSTRLFSVCLLALTACQSPVAPPLPAVPPAAAPVRLPPTPRAGPITHYRFELARVGALIGVRSFEQGGRSWRLVVDPRSLRTSVVAAEVTQPLTWDLIESSPWMEARLDADQASASLQDSGLTHVLPKEAGFVLTVDLCPSTKHFDLRLIKMLLAVVEPAERPVPVAFAVSGVWLQEHPDDLALLKQLDGTELSITWINHSMHHRYSPRLPLIRNFLLQPGSNIASEVLDAEVAMLERGLTPSIFFRFPGLVSEPTLVLFVTGLGLVPVGSDAWLAKGEQARRGSIVLVHGNGNEPRGIDDFLKLLDAEKSAISKKQFLLLDLSEAVSETEP